MSRKEKKQHEQVLCDNEKNLYHESLNEDRLYLLQHHYSLNIDIDHDQISMYEVEVNYSMQLNDILNQDVHRRFSIHDHDETI